MNEVKDDQLWQIARKRAAFRRSLYSGIAIVLFMWVIWWATTGKDTGFTGTPWPVWVMLGFGISLGRQYFNAYKGNKQDLTEQEYQKLIRERKDV